MVMKHVLKLLMLIGKVDIIDSIMEELGVEFSRREKVAERRGVSRQPFAPCILPNSSEAM